MSENTSNPNEPQKLTDDELSQVAGGVGSWSDVEEESLQHRYEMQGKPGTFEEWYLKESLGRGAEDLNARKAWIADGSPSWRWYYYDNGRVWYLQR